MPAITITELNNAQLDVTHIAAIATSTASTATDRLGNVKQTMAGVVVGLNAQAAITATGINAATAKSAAASALLSQNAALIQAGVYVDEPTGRAAVADGAAFKVQGIGDIAALEYRRTSSAASVLIASYPSTAAFDSLYIERMVASQSGALERKRNNSVQLPKAAVVLLLGQSNNTPRGTSLSGIISPNVFMPAGGNSMTYFPYFSFNADSAVCGWADVSTAVVHQEGTAESPCSGIALGLLGGVYNRVYICSVAKGSSSLAYLHGPSAMTNLNAVVTKLCDSVRAAGYEPQVLFDAHQGESDASNGRTEAQYFADAFDYYRQAKMFAALAMDKPDYEAPIVFHMPLAYGSFGTAPNMRNVANAIRRLAKEIPNAILAGGSFQFDTDPADRVHQTNIGMRQRGEYGGYLLNQYAQLGRLEHSPSIVDVKRNGAVVTVIFSVPVINDAALLYGSALNASNALYGLEFMDDAAFIKINSITFAGRVATVTLNSNPTGAVQTLQIASQAITGGGSGDGLLPGTSIRAPGSGVPSVYTPSRVYYDLCTPQLINVR